MEFFSKHKLTFLLAGIIVVAIVWYGFPTGSSTTSLISTDTPASSDPASQSLVETLLTLRAVTLSGTILSDSVFLGLKDFTTEIIPEASGRPDPFAPLQSPTRTGVDPKTTTLFTPTK